MTALTGKKRQSDTAASSGNAASSEAVAKAAVPDRREALRRGLIVGGLTLLGVLALVGIALYLDVIERRGLPDPIDIFFAVILTNVLVIGGGLWFVRGIAWVREALYGRERESLEPGVDDHQPGIDELLRAEREDDVIGGSQRPH